MTNEEAIAYYTKALSWSSKGSREYKAAEVALRALRGMVAFETLAVQHDAVWIEREFNLTDDSIWFEVCGWDGDGVAGEISKHTDLASAAIAAAGKLEE